MSHSETKGWTPSAALTPCIAISTAFAYSLYILSSPSHHRLENLALVFALASGFEKSFSDLYPDDLTNVAFAHGVLIWVVHMVHVTLVQGDASYISGDSIQLRDQKGGWTSVSAPGLGTYHRGYKMLWNFRGIGTSWQVVKIVQPELQDIRTKRQLRRRFFLRRILTILCRYMTLAILYEVSESNILSRPPAGRLTAQGIVTGTQLTIYFILHNWLWIASGHECLSIVFIYILRLDEPYEWPPIYGSLLEAYTVRRFWAYFWHRLVYAPFRAIADNVSVCVFGQGNRGAARRLGNVAMVFLLSGILHSIMDWKKGACNCCVSGMFYFVQPLGFLLESLVRFAWGPLRSRMFVPGSRVLSIFERTLGYMWVWTWFFWLYPQRAVVEFNCRAKHTPR